MKFKIPKIIKLLDMGEYDECLRGQTLHMWVNPPRQMILESQTIRQDLDERLNLLKEIKDPEDMRRVYDEMSAISDHLFDWWARMLSQSDDEATHLTQEDVKQFATESADTDPQLWVFIQKRCYQMMLDHRTLTKKNSRPQ